MQHFATYIADLALPLRLAAFAGLAVATHLVVITVRHLARGFLAGQSKHQYQKLQSISTLASSAIIFALYFLALGFILQELGVSLTAYLASASVIGLAIGFGSQGIVQDVVTGLTFIFSDLIDVGDLVEISGQTGIVKAITMRFVELENALGATVYIPNRTINNVVNYPRGYIRCLVDVTLPGNANERDQAERIALDLMRSIHQQFPGILITEPSSEGRHEFTSGKQVLRLKYRIWPNRGGPIETTFCQELVSALQRIDPDYKPWMVALSYEVEEKTARANPIWPWRRKPARAEQP